MKNYLIKTLNGMALGLFSSLIIGLILKQIGDLSSIEQLSLFGRTAQFMMGPAIGAAVAHAIGAGPLVIFASLVTGAMGNETVTINLYFCINLYRNIDLIDRIPFASCKRCKLSVNCF